MAKKPTTTAKSDTTKVQPRYVTTPSDVQKMAKQTDRSFMSKNDTTRLKNLENLKSDNSLLKRNMERMSQSKAPLPKPTPTKYAKDLPKKK